MAAAIIAGFAVALLAPLACCRWGLRARYLFVLYPSAVAAYLAGSYAGIVSGAVQRTSLPWLPALGVHFSFLLDGLSLLFALLVSAIGALVVVYAGAYLKGHPHQGRFFAFLLMFMSSMLGLVLSDNAIALFVFWELTSVSSYLLIGFEHQREASRRAALQALLVTGFGGLAMLAGLILIGSITGSYELSVILERGEVLRAHPLYLPILLLILTGAFSKSALFPFHFWLPNAMEAPTPVSAYLHSATMVKAGIYLLARLSPALAETASWHYLVTLGGAATMVAGAVLAFAQRDLKKILAYSTVSALGTLALLLGLNTVEATKAGVVFLIVHSMYKGALFMIAGTLAHETGTRDLEALGGLRRLMPVSAATALLAALSMAGLPPLLGFISKELIYDAKLQAPRAQEYITALGVTANAMIVAVACMLALGPFYGRRRETPRPAHEAPWPMLLGPALLAGMGVIIGMMPGIFAAPVVSAAVAALHPGTTGVQIPLWKGFNLVLGLSLLTVLMGVALYAGRARLLRIFARLRPMANVGPLRAYDGVLAGTMALARVLTRLVQSGYLRLYVATVILFLAAALISAMVLGGVGSGGLRLTALQISEASLGTVMVLAALTVARARSLLAAVAALGIVGYGVALMFVMFSAPDLAMTQFAVETLTIILFILVLSRLPRLRPLSRPAARMRDALGAAAAGALVAASVLFAARHGPASRLAGYFADNSLPLAHGRNIVNVILVDFRALDTLGEITVISVAAVGVLALLRLRARAGMEGGEP
jgi:multicomponent Na+:H+ antiporter subunit A